MEHLIQRMGIRINTVVTWLSKDCLEMCRANSQLDVNFIMVRTLRSQFRVSWKEETKDNHRPLTKVKVERMKAFLRRFQSSTIIVQREF
jgi:hypothetical protein